MTLLLGKRDWYNNQGTKPFSMETYFYNRTAYQFVSVEVPQCFKDLDGYFCTRFASLGAALGHECVTLAENVCRRMADVELYASYIFEVPKSADKFRGAILIGSLLVAYFSACKSLLDAVSITLTRLYKLQVGTKEMDFSKPKFWRALKSKVPQVHDQYKPFSNLFRQVVNWRDAAVHRLTPLVIVHVPGDPEQVPVDKQEIKMVSEPDAVLSCLVSRPLEVTWTEPLNYHKQWQPQFIKLCEGVCRDIQANT